MTRPDIDALRAEIAFLTTERDEWEANEQEQYRRVVALEAALRAAVERCGSTEHADPWCGIPCKDHVRKLKCESCRSALDLLELLDGSDQ